MQRSSQQRWIQPNFNYSWVPGQDLFNFIAKEPEPCARRRATLSSLTDCAHKKTAGARTGGFSEETVLLKRFT
jgi:hypothetical protein